MSTATADPVVDITYGTERIDRFVVQGRDEDGRANFMSIGDSVAATPTERFWTSLAVRYSTYGLSNKLYSMFSEEEVFDRLVSVVEPEETVVRYAVEHRASGVKRILAVTRAESQVVRYDQLQEMLQGRVEHKHYADGTVFTSHLPEYMDPLFIGREEFTPGFGSETPIDGFGQPSLYLRMVRMICTNGVIAYAPAFRQKVNLGKTEGAVGLLARQFDTFNNPEGFAAMRARMESAMSTTASMYEANQLFKAISDTRKGAKFEVPSNSGIAEAARRRSLEYTSPMAQHEDPHFVTLTRAFIDLTGDQLISYGVAARDEVSEKRQKLMPMRCSVADLINLASEITTHCMPDANDIQRRKLNGFVGNTLVEEYDLEGTNTHGSEPVAWHTDLTKSQAHKLN